MSGNHTRIAAGLLGVILGLLLVGLVSHTPLRHLIQVSPAVLALVLVNRQVTWARFAAMPILAFWLLIMLGIWLFLLGVADVITGTYSPMEIGLTIIIGLSCLVGLVAAGRSSVSGPRGSGVVAFLGFTILQVGAMSVGLRPAFSRS